MLLIARSKRWKKNNPPTLFKLTYDINPTLHCFTLSKQFTGPLPAANNTFSSADVLPVAYQVHIALWFCMNLHDTRLHYQGVSWWKNGIWVCSYISWLVFHFFTNEWITSTKPIWKFAWAPLRVHLIPLKWMERAWSKWKCTLRDLLKWSTHREDRTNGWNCFKYSRK